MTMPSDNAPPAPRRPRADSVPPERYEAFGIEMTRMLIQLTREEPGWIQTLLDTACATTDPKEKQAAGFLALLLVNLNKEAIEAHMTAQFAGGGRACATQEDHLS